MNKRKIKIRVFTFFMLIIICFSSHIYAEISSYSQYDRRWKDYDYGYRNSSKTKKATISSSGCGLLALTNAINYMNDVFISPIELADYSIAHDCRVNGSGTSTLLYNKLSKSNYGKEYDFSATLPANVSLSKMKT